MAFFDALMERMASTDAGVLSDVTASFLTSPRPVAEKRWTSWVRAEQARLRGDVARCSRWLDVAGRLGDKPADDPVWTAECALTTGELLAAIGEPGQAFGHLREAFEAWQLAFDTMLAPVRRARRERRVGRSVEEFTRVLLGDDTQGINPGSPQVMVAWSQERLVPKTIQSGSSLIRVASHAGGTEVAERAADHLLAWLPKVVQGTTLGIFVADVHRDLGNHYQEVGRFSDAVVEAERALEALEPVSGDGLAAGRIRQLRFNRANGLARCGRETEAIDVYRQLEEAFRSAGDQEPALRTRYARLHLQWQTAGGAAVRDELRQLVADYQALLRTLDRNKTEYAAVKAVLEAPYRLLLTVVAEGRPEDSDSLHELFAIVGALRDESTVVEVDRIAEVSSVDLKCVVRSPIALLDRRLRRLPDALLLLVEPGVDCAVFIALRGGNEPLARRLTVAMAGLEFGRTAAALVHEVRTASHLLIARAASARALDGAPVRTASEALTRTVPEAVRALLTGARTIFYSPSAMADADDVPLELMHVGEDHLALTRVVARIPSLRHLIEILAPNRVDRAPVPRATVVRAADPPELDRLDNAEEDAEQVLRALGILGLTAKLDRAPTARQLLATLDSGIGLVHYIGHGMAVDAGEHLFLGPGERLPAFELDALDGSRTPFLYLSTCLVGRGRHLAGGRLKGFAVALLRHGAPGVVAASYVVPDHICAAISIAFYRGAWKHPVGEAMRQARRRLSADGLHPVCWTTFSLHGDPYATISGAVEPDSAARRTCDWPALLTRFLATGADEYREACRRRLEEAAQTHPEYRATLVGVTTLLDSGSPLSDSLPAVIEDLASFDVEGAAAVRLVQAWRRLEALRKQEMTTADRESCRQEIGTALSLALALHDSYAFLTFAVAHNELLMVSMEETLAVLRHAAHCGRALEADEQLLRPARTKVETTLKSMESSMILDVPGLLGVDPELIRRADEGDEDALREINSQVMARKAGVNLAVSGGHWTDWMLRYIATDAEPILGGLMAAVDAEKQSRTGRSESVELLWRYLSSYRGEGEADSDLYAALQQKLPREGRERSVLALFRVFDQVVSHSDSYPRSLAIDGLAMAEALGHQGATLYFHMLVAQVDIREGRLSEARDRLLTIIEPLRRLTAEDSEDGGRLRMSVQNAIALSQMIGDKTAARAIMTEFGAVLTTPTPDDDRPT